ncbi:MAG TPA: MurR/RpiR family transcriptional regulator [Luteimonas sp.]|nr:MurR/RpiR family transcriptional regulator [Luteimonas sp.]HRO26365.1 MurR/RpiR family transcriptional regulator [Luteimonas sp.]HRP71306.1 MurR/RpiR family transcriptional regulator [Luteimonas sp.]
MQPLLVIRSERGQMSAIERRIADFILDNAHLLRDYSSQQLANALGISQSSVVKFSQKFGFKGYPDLKYSIGEAIARNGDVARPAESDEGESRQDALARTLWQAKSRAEEETRLLNPPEQIEAVAAMIRDAGKIFVVGIGEDSVLARAFAIRLSLLGFLAIHHFDAVLVPAEVSSSQPGDVLLLFSERGEATLLCQLARTVRARGGKVVSITRHTANALRAHADLSLLVSAHDEAPHVELLLYQAALQHLADLVFVLLCGDESRRRRLDDYHEHVRSLLDA